MVSEHSGFAEGWLALQLPRPGPFSTLFVCSWCQVIKGSPIN